MRTLRVPVAAALSAVLGTFTLIGAAAPAVADTSTTLPVSSSSDIVVDGVHRHVFISSPSGSVVVTDYSGAVVDQLASLPGASGMALSPDSGTLYVALPGADAIAAIDTAGLKESARYSTGAGTEPEHLALAGGKLWFGYGAAAQGNLGSLDLSGAQPVVTLGQEGGHGFYSAPLLASSPAAPGVLVAGAADQSPAELQVYDVSGGTAVSTAYRWNPNNSGNLQDLAVTPDGRDVVAASGAPYVHEVYRLTDLSNDGSYPTAAYPDAVAVAPDGTVAAGIDGMYSPDVYVFPAGVTTPLRTYEFDPAGGGDNVLQSAGLAWAPDGSRLFALTGSVSSGSAPLTLRVLDDPARTAATLTVSVPATAPLDKPLTISGTLGSAVPFAAGTTVLVSRTDLTSPHGTPVGTATVAADGTFHISDTPRTGGAVVYTVAYAGDDRHTAASATGTVQVSRPATRLDLRADRGTYAYGATARLVAHLGRTYRDRTVAIYATPAGGTQTLVASGTADRNGDLKGSYKLTRNTRFTARFNGDARTAPASAARSVGTQVSVRTDLGRWYARARVHGTTVYRFHSSTDPLLTTVMTYQPGRCVVYTLAVYSHGHWQERNSGCFALDGSGRSLVQLTGTHPAGYLFRVRAAYLAGTSGDSLNTTTYGPWLYFSYTR